MSLSDDIIAATRSVVSMLGMAWQYRKMTSAANVYPRTYGSYVDVTAIPTGGQWAEEYEDSRGQRFRKRLFKFRVRDDVAELVPGDQVKDTGSVVWAVRSRTSGAYGSIIYTAERDEALTSEPDRGGSV
jgi:hypothetical protein